MTYTLSYLNSLVRLNTLDSFHISRYYSREKKDADPYNISSMELGSLPESETFLKDAASLMIV